MLVSAVLHGLHVSQTHGHVRGRVDGRVTRHQSRFGGSEHGFACLSFLQSGLGRAVREESDGALAIVSHRPGVDEFLQRVDDFAIRGHPIVGRLIVIDSQESASLAKVPPADGKGANIVNGVARDTKAFAVLDYDGVLLAVSVGVVKLNGQLAVALVKCYLDETVGGGFGVDTDGMSVRHNIDGGPSHVGVVVSDGAEASMRKVRSQQVRAAFRAGKVVVGLIIGDDVRVSSN